MPEKPELGETMVGFRPNITATPEGVKAPAIYSNTARVVYDPNGFTIYFFAAPADLGSLPEAQQQLRDEKGNLRSPAKGQVNVALDPLVKIFLPPAVMQGLARLVNQSYADWHSLYAPDVARFLELGSEGQESEADSSSSPIDESQKSK